MIPPTAPVPNQTSTERMASSIERAMITEVATRVESRTS
jgi:hypothetical protein